MRALTNALALGSGVGLGLGLAYLAAARSALPVTPPDTARTVSFSPSRTSTPVSAASAKVGVANALRARFRFPVFSILKGAEPFHAAAVADAPTDRTCLAEAIYFEARGEPKAGQQAVAQVVLNRVRHPAFPKTVCGVVHQRTAANCQFAFACTAERPALGSLAWRRSEDVAAAALHGAVMAAVGDATHFQAVRSGAFAGLVKVAEVGAHVFYRFGGHEGAAAMFHQAPSPSQAVPVEVTRALAKAEPTAAGRVEVILPVGSKADALPARLAALTPAPAPSSRTAALQAGGTAVRPQLAKLPAGSTPDALPARLEASATPPAVVSPLVKPAFLKPTVMASLAS